MRPWSRPSHLEGLCNGLARKELRVALHRLQAYIASIYSAATEFFTHPSTSRWPPDPGPLLTPSPLPLPLLQVLGSVRSLALGRAQPICVASATRLIGLLPNLEQLFLLDLSDANYKQVRCLGALSGVP